MLVLLSLAAGIAAPFLDADAFRANIQSALEETLGRKVEIGQVHFTLFTGPGFTLDNVTIHEDPHFGLEPFAFVPTLEVRVRLDKLLLGQIRPLGLRLVDPSLNLVKSDDGIWNAVALVERLGAPRRTPLNFFPAVQITNARFDFKLGVRKTTFYLTETAVSLYPESSGKIYFRFEGSPARTDRRGHGFGHLTGAANWYLRPAANGNQLEADVNLEPSNLSELATLIQGQDLGVHGNVSAHVLIDGPFSSLQAQGDLRLDDIHRWDLLPSPGDSWRVHFRALADLEKHTFDLTTLPISPTENPLMLQVKSSNFMTQPTWSVLATMQKAPLASLLPLGKRMGMALPAGLQMDGSLDGVIGFTNMAFSNQALSNQARVEGGVVITNAVANIPNVPPLRSASATVIISGHTIHVDPAILQSDMGGTLRAGGDFDLATQNLTADITTNQCSIAAFKQTTNAWFGSPKALALVDDGDLTGRFQVQYPANTSAPLWSGQAQIANATIHLPGAALPLTEVQGKAAFDEDTFDLPKLSGLLGDLAFSASYRYTASAKHSERLRVDFPAADLDTLEADLAPTLSDNGLLSRLPFTRRVIPAWLAGRNLEGDLAIAKCSVNELPLGPLNTHFLWQGSSIELTSAQLGLPGGRLLAKGNIALSGRLPSYHLAAKADHYAWSGGTLAIDAQADTSGLGLVMLQRLEASGGFSAENVTLGAADPVESIAGRFTFAFNGTTPLLKLTHIEAHAGDSDWLGDGANQPDGKVHLDLTNGDRQLHLLADLKSTEALP